MITSTQKKEIVKLKQDGLCVSKIAKMCGIHRTTVWYHVRRSDKPIVQRSKKGGAKQKRIPKTKKQVLLEEARSIRSKVVKTYNDYLRGIIELERDEKGNIIGKRLLESV